MSYLTATARLLFLALFLSLAACSTGPTKVKSSLNLNGLPDWVNEGTSILNDKNGRLFHGVGSADPMGGMALQISVADDRARAEVARILSSYMDIVSSDYLSSAKSGETAVNEEAVSRQIKNFTKVNLTGTRIIGHWRDIKTGIIYSIAELDMNQIQKTLSAVKDMNADLKQYIKDSGDNIFDRVAKEKK